MKYKLLIKTIENIKKLCYNKNTIQKIRNGKRKGEIGMKYTALDIAKYVINSCAENLNAISNLQLQKILYFIQGEYYKHKNEFLFDDDFEAWPYGPVVGEVYSEYRFYGGSKIYGTEAPKKEIELEDQKIIDEVISRKCQMSAFELVNETHKPEGAWDLTFRDGFGRGDIITKQKILDELKN